MDAPDRNERRAPYVFILIFAVLAVGIIIAGHFYFRAYEAYYRAEVERELAAIAELKVNELAEWRSERFRDAAVFYQNPAFSALVRRTLQDPDDVEAQGHLQAWLAPIQAAHRYDRLFLLDAQGIERMAVPAARRPIAADLLQRASETLRSGKITLVDFYRDEHDQRVYLTLLVPVLDAQEGSLPIGIFALRIDPEHYLYPFVENWPTPSRTAETLLVRRDGDDVLFLSELRFQTNTALTLRMPLTRKDAPAVQAALGHEGIMEGVDYRGVPVLAAVRTVPDSPWFLVARMDVSEVYAPVRERRWMTAVVVAALLTSVGAGARLLWWRQHARLYEELSRASVALRDSAALNRDVLDALTANVAVLDAYGTIVTVNERWRRFARENQASTDGNDFVGANYLAICEKSKGPESNAGAQAALVGIGAVMDGSQTQFSLEYPCHSPDQQRWFLMYVSPLGDSRGGVVVAHLDITERRRLEHELRSQNAALEAAANAVAITDWGGVIQWVNPAFTALTGYAREEAIGRNPRDLVKSGKHDHAFYAALWRTILAGQVWHGEMVNRRKDGSLYTEEQTITPLRDERGEISQFIAIKQDISERTRAETALRESQARLNGIVDSAMDGIVTIDDQERIVVFNAAAEKMFGCPAIEAIGQPVERFIPERFRAAHHGHLRHFSQTGDTQRAAGQFIRVSALRADGEEFPIEASISRIEVDGHLLLTIIHRDVTERVRGEEARAQLEAQLRLAQKMEALGTLAGGIAHDFNNILGAIIGNAELARQDVGSSHPAVESLNEIRKAGHRAKDLVQRILAFSSEQSRPRSVISLRPVVEETVTLLRATLPAGVAIVTAFDADTPTVLADPTQIHQVLMNLCTNAWHALEGHAGRIDIHLDGVTLDAEAADAVATLRPGRFARLSVTDTGKGMNADTVERIFDPFFTTKPVGQGTGLGLSVVHGIMKAHDGAVTVASQPGSGTTFHLYFPAAAAPQPPAEPEPTAVEPVPAAGVQHVLYLDDEESLVFLVTRTLERLGYRVSGYTQAEAALAAVRADPTQFDLVLTDLNMPGISGLEVARELSRLRPELPVVLASGYITEELRAHALQAGVRQLIYKPNTVEELCDMVQRLAGEPRSA